MSKRSKILVDLGCGDGGTMMNVKKFDKLNYLSNCYKIGVDAFLPYINHSRYIYDDVILCDIRQLPLKKRSIDMVLCLDVIEHLKKSDGWALIKSAEEIARKQVIFFTPVGFLPQSEYDANVYQIHTSGWFPKEFKRIDYKVRGLRGFSFIMRVAHFTWKNNILGELALFLGLLTQPLIYLIPSYAFQMICSKHVCCTRSGQSDMILRC